MYTFRSRMRSMLIQPNRRTRVPAKACSRTSFEKLCLTRIVEKSALNSETLKPQTSAQEGSGTAAGVWGFRVEGSEILPFWGSYLITPYSSA